MKSISTRQLNFNWVSLLSARLIAQSVSLTATFFAVMILVAYVYNVDSVYRIFDSGPATNPLTAACLTLLGLTIYLNACALFLLVQRAFNYIVLALSLIRLVDGILNTQIHNAFIPFQQLMAYEHLIGLSNFMGVNTALMIFVAALALVLLDLKKIRMSFALVICSFLIPIISLFGYLFDLPGVYGEMAITTAGIGLLSIASLLVHIVVEHHARLGMGWGEPDALKWSDAFSVGDQTLDQQHQKMLSLVNQMVRKGATLKRQELSNLFKQMKQYTEEHLKYEEELLERIGYPHTESHRVIHQFYIKKVDLLLEQFQHDHCVELRQEAANFLREWWIYHVLDEDMRYKPYINRLK